MYLWHFACAAANAGDETPEALAWKLKPPPGFGSGKFGTPFERMQFANARPGDCPRLDEDGGWEGVDDASAACEPVELLPPPQAPTSSAVATAPRPSTTRAGCILRLLSLVNDHGITDQDLEPRVTAT
jgi:hypothetical protein